MARLVRWSQYGESIGDRSGLFSAVADAWPIQRTFHPGSYVGRAPSSAFPSVVFVYSDRPRVSLPTDVGGVSHEEDAAALAEEAHRVAHRSRG